MPQVVQDSRPPSSSRMSPPLKKKISQPSYQAGNDSGVQSHSPLLSASQYRRPTMQSLLYSPTQSPLPLIGREVKKTQSLAQSLPSARDHQISPSPMLPLLDVLQMPTQPTQSQSQSQSQVPSRSLHPSINSSAPLVTLCPTTVLPDCNAWDSNHVPETPKPRSKSRKGSKETRSKKPKKTRKKATQGESSTQVTCKRRKFGKKGGQEPIQPSYHKCIDHSSDNEFSTIKTNTNTLKTNTTLES